MLRIFIFKVYTFKLYTFLNAKLATIFKLINHNKLNQ